jgi:hypothetical protein
VAWIVQPLQRKNKDGSPSGLWRLCAESDEGGGFHVGCGHDHASADEAMRCEDARRNVAGVTGTPYEPLRQQLPNAPGRVAPRRDYVDLWTPAEKAIYDAMQYVELAGSSPELTEAVVLLGKARDKVSDHVDGVKG